MINPIYRTIITINFKIYNFAKILITQLEILL